MNVTLLIRGPIRPTDQSALDNINFFLKSLEGHSVCSYLWAWDTPIARQLLTRVVIDHVLLVEEPSDDYIHSVIGKDFSMTNYIRCFKQYWSMKRATEWVGEAHDFVVQFRADMRIQIADLSSWLNPEHYTTIHTRFDKEFTNDQFGIAKIDVMRRAWNYHDEATLIEFMKSARCPEDVLDRIVLKNDVKLKQAHLSVWTLDPDRHILS
jgi:hypothetical protein